MIRTTLRTCLVLAALYALPSQALALKWGEFHAERHDRFYHEASPARAFIGEGMDWSGVGTWQNGWATMISDSYFLTSYHVRWALGQSNPLPVEFQRTNVIDTHDPANFASIDIDTSYGVRIGNTDLYIGRLSEPVPGWVRKYPLIKRNDQANWLSYQDTTAWIYGRSPSASPDPTYLKAAVGKNQVYSAFSSSKVLDTASVALKWSSRADAGSFGIDEVNTIGGDSSGPTFFASPYPGGLALAGLHASYDTDASVSAYLTQIRSVVPEPISIVTDQFGDLNGDFRVDGSDYVTLVRNIGMTSATSSNIGDLNGDRRINVIDQLLITKYLHSGVFAPADFNRDGMVDSSDMKVVGNNWLRTSVDSLSGDATGDGKVNQDDIAVLNTNWRFDINRSRPIPTIAPRADMNGDRFVDNADLAIMSSVGQGCAACDGDFNRDGRVDIADWVIFSRDYNPFRPGDINFDNVVNNADMSKLLSNWGRRSNALADGDINRDGLIDARDFSIMADWWGYGVPSNGGQPNLNVTPIPEPTALALVGAGLLAAALLAAAIPRRRRP